MKDKCSKIASIVMAVLFILSAAVLVVFFTVGFNETGSVASGIVRWPKFTDLLMYWMYFLVALCLICTIVGILIAKGAKIDSQMPKAAGVLRAIGSFLFVPLLIVGFVLGSSAAVRTGQGIYDNPFWCQATDALLYTIYALVGITLLGLILNLTGIFKK
jgi:hypothetical protein